MEYMTKEEFIETLKKYPDGISLCQLEAFENKTIRKEVIIKLAARRIIDFECHVKNTYTLYYQGKPTNTTITKDETIWKYKEPDGND